MIKVFLVEDEVIIRNGIKNNIPWEAEGFEFAGEASDGELAWPMIRRLRPEILITDIRMPFMNGLELSALVRKELPDTKIVILSGFGEFEYAKQAISLGVTEYLLKPISSEKLLEVIKKIGAVIREEQKQRVLVERYQKEMQENVRFEKKRLFDRLLLGSSAASVLLEQGNALEMDLTASFYRVVLFKLILPEELNGLDGIIPQAMERVDVSVSGYERVLAFERGPEGWSFLIKEETSEEMEAETERLCRNLEELMKDFPKLRYFGGIGETVQRLGDVRYSYQTASKAFAGRFFVEQNQFVDQKAMAALGDQQRAEKSPRTVDASNIDRKLAENFLKSGIEEEVSDFVEEYFERIGKDNYRSLMFCHYLIVDMHLCACQFLESRSISQELLSQECRDITYFSRCAGHPESMMAYVKRLFTETLRLRDRMTRSKYQDIIEQAKECIARNFQNNEFSMNQAAAMVNVSPSYFSTLFRQETGTTFIEYLTELRLEKARELLMCTELRSSEIGYQVGYKDSHYFSYIFKKVCGCTPKEYRQRKYEGQP